MSGTDDCMGVYAWRGGPTYKCCLEAGHIGPRVTADLEWAWREGEKPYLIEPWKRG